MTRVFGGWLEGDWPIPDGQLEIHLSAGDPTDAAPRDVVPVAEQHATPAFTQEDDPFVLLIPDYAEDSLLVDIIARLRWEDEQVFYSHLGGWESLAEPVRRDWRLRTIRDLKEATGRGGK